MTEDKMRGEIMRLVGRIAALESICTVLLGQLVQGDAAAKRTIAEGLLRSISDFPIDNAGREGMAETATKIANNLMSGVDGGHGETP